MKKVPFLMIAFILLFTQCGKEQMEEHNEEGKLVPITFELPLTQETRSYFGDLLPNGEVKWGNDSNIEYIYISIPHTISYYYDSTGTVSLGSLVELKAEVNEPTDRLIFKGEAASNNLQNGRTYHLYYFGNNGQGLDGTNVKNYHSFFRNIMIGKKVTFSRQTGDINKLGDYHIAKIRVTTKKYKDESGMVQRFELVAKDLKNINSIAKLDLTGETKLGGTAAELQSFTVLWNPKADTFEEIIETIPSATIDVSNNAGKDSYISLLPVEENVFLECTKGRYNFTNGIGQNQLYVGSEATDIDAALPLRWE